MYSKSPNTRAYSSFVKPRISSGVFSTTSMPASLKSSEADQLFISEFNISLKVRNRFSLQCQSFLGIAKLSVLGENETQIGRTFLYIRENIQSLTIKVKRIEYYRKDPIELQKKSFKSVEKVMNNKFNTDFFINQGKNLSSNKQTHTLNIP